jgi:hypothetical protein
LSEKNDALRDLAERTMRGPKTSVYQQMLAQKLIKANQTPQPLHKIRYACEAAFLCRNKENLDMARIQAINTVVQSLLNTEIPKAGSQKVDIIIIAWSYPKTEGKYKFHVAPWHKLSLRYYPWETEVRRRKYPQKGRRSTSNSYWDQVEDENAYADYQEEVIDKIKEEINSMPQHEKFFQMTGALGRNSFYRLKAEFEGWAVPIVLEAMATMVDGIDPRVYSETLATMYGQDTEE